MYLVFSKISPLGIFFENNKAIARSGFLSILMLIALAHLKEFFPSKSSKSSICSIFLLLDSNLIFTNWPIEHRGSHRTRYIRSALRGHE